MTDRQLSNWLESYVQYSSISEAPKIFHFWAGVSAVAGALRRHVWFDQIKFQWFPSFYIIFVAPPAIATKSVTADGSMDLLRAIPGIHFGPDEVTWQQLVSSFATASESFEIDGEWYPQSPITLLASEFGMLMDFKDTKMVNLFITLWDGRKQFEKQTKKSGNDSIEAPWVNMLACTTPQWISSNMDANTIGGGFTSRCVFVYAEKKERPIAFLEDEVESRAQYDGLKLDLIQDLERISTIPRGRYRLTPAAKAWAKNWYDMLWSTEYNLANEDYVNNYIGRKQAHLIKLAMILAVSKRDEMILELEEVQLADVMLRTTEENFRKVFSKIGRSEESVQADKILSFIQAKGEAPYKEVHRLAQIYFPNAKNFEGILESFIKGGQVELKIDPSRGPILVYLAH